METDAEYFSRRAQQEREAAMAAVHPHAREAHLELARGYDDIAGALIGQERRLGQSAYSELVTHAE